MNRIGILFVILFLLFLGVALIGGLTWANVNFTAYTTAGADFLNLRQAAIRFLAEGASPYDLLGGANPIALPFYSLLFFFPLARIEDANLARAVWMTFLELGLIAFGLTCLSLRNWRTNTLIVSAFLIFGLLSFHSLSALAQASPGILSALLLGGALFALRSEADELSGALIAFAIFDIQATALVIAFIFIWVFAQSRWRILLGFGLTLAVLIFISTLLSPNWHIDFLTMLVFYWREQVTGRYTFTQSVMGTFLANGLSISLIFILLYEWWTARKKDFARLLWTVSLTFVVTPLIGLPTSIAAQAVLLLPFTLILATVDERWGRWGRGFSSILLLAFFFGFWRLAQSGASSVVNLYLFPLMIFILLYWVRWWMLFPARTWLDEMSRA